MLKGQQAEEITNDIIKFSITSLLLFFKFVVIGIVNWFCLSFLLFFLGGGGLNTNLAHEFLSKFKTLRLKSKNETRNV